MEPFLLVNRDRVLHTFSINYSKSLRTYCVHSFVLFACNFDTNQFSISLLSRKLLDLSLYLILNGIQIFKFYRLNTKRTTHELCRADEWRLASDDPSRPTLYSGEEKFFVWWRRAHIAPSLSHAASSFSITHSPTPEMGQPKASRRRFSSSSQQRREWCSSVLRRRSNNLVIMEGHVVVPFLLLPLPRLLRKLSAGWLGRMRNNLRLRLGAQKVHR